MVVALLTDEAARGASQQGQNAMIRANSGARETPEPESMMRALFGVVSLLIVLAIVGIAAKKQLQAVGNLGAAMPPAQSSGDATTVAPAASTVRAQSQQLQQRVADDVNKALQQGAARDESAEK